MPKESWLDIIARSMREFDAAQSLGNIQRKLDEVEFRKNPGLWMWTKPASLGIEALSQVGRPIAAAGGALGAMGSEAGSEAAQAGHDTEQMRMGLEGAKQGWLEGEDTFKDTVGALDVAALATGGLGGLATKAASATGKGIGIDKALQTADLGLSAADAALGSGQVYEGTRDKDLAKLAMGVARIAGNTYGVYRSAKDLGALNKLGIDAPLEATARRKPNVSHKAPGGPVKLNDDDALTAIQNQIGPDGYAGRHLDESIKDANDLVMTIHQTLDMKHGAQYPKLDGRKYNWNPNDRDDYGLFKTMDQLKDPDGETFTIEAVSDRVDVPDTEDTLGSSHGIEPVERVYADMLTDSPEKQNLLGLYSKMVRTADAEGQDLLHGPMSAAIDEIAPPGGPTNPLVGYSQSGRFRGIAIGSPSEGFTYPDKALWFESGPRRGYNLSEEPLTFNRAYFLNPQNTVQRIDVEFENLLTGNVDDFLLNRFAA